MSYPVSLPSSLASNIGRKVNLLCLDGFVILAYAWILQNPASTPIRTFSLMFASIILEAMPFMLLGAFLGGLIEAFVSRERLMALLPKRGWVTVFLCAGLGFILPVCECAVVPVVRRLGRKGLPPAAAVAYLLGGPIANPIVFASTALAYRFDWRIALLRCSLGYGIAVTIGLLVGWIFRRRSIFHPDVHPETAHRNSKHRHTHSHHGTGSCACGHHHDESPSSLSQKVTHALQHAADDFFTVGHYLVIGAFIAALAQTYIDRNWILGMTQHPVLPLLLMMALAILLNLCSEADAFIAASFRGLMPPAAQMAFMLVGPMFDLKLLLMYQGVFRKRVIVTLAGLILLCVLVTVFILAMGRGGTL